jgi:uncharacterized membrane protein
MTWSQRYRFRNYVQSSLWIVPLSGALFGGLFHRLIWKFDLWARPELLDFTQDGARAVVSAISSSFLTFIVFLLTMLFIAVQIAEAQLTPRIIANVFRRRTEKLSLGFFVFTYVFSVSVQGRIGNPVPQLAVLVTAIFSVVSIGVFLYLVGYIGKSLRPVSIYAGVAEDGARAIEALYPVPLVDPANAGVDEIFSQNTKPPLTIRHRGKSGAFRAFDARGLVEAAARKGCVIRLIPEVGDFVAEGDPLFQVYGGGDAVEERGLQQRVAFGVDRAIEQDPAFAFRIIVDIAIKALSPAINDPTTAVRGIDQIHRLLHIVGTRDLGDGRVRDRTGQLRLVFPTANWEDFVWLGVSEIRLYGAGSIQIMRRLREMLENLIEVLPAYRSPPLREQLELIGRSMERNFSDPEDRKLAGVADHNGIGGSRLGRFGGTVSKK